MENKKNPVLAVALVALLLLFFGGAAAFFLVSQPQPRMDNFSYAQTQRTGSDYSEKASLALDTNIKDLKVPQNIETIEVVAKPIKAVKDLSENINKDSLPRDDNQIMEPGQADSNTKKGFLDKSVIKRVIARKSNEIKYCYQKELLKNPELEGKILVSWKIKPDGKVEDVKFEEGSLKTENIQVCVVSKIKRWVFPKPEGEGDVLIKYPFVLKTN